MKKHLDLKLSGKVQGVGFRYQAKESADQLGLRGHARNMRDGSVEIEIEGEEKDLESFIAWCKSDANLATVKDLSVRQGYVRGYREFQTY